MRPIQQPPYLYMVGKPKPVIEDKPYIRYKLLSTLSPTVTKSQAFAKTDDMQT